MDNFILNTVVEKYVNCLWPQIESYFIVLKHSETSYVSSLEGAKEIIWIFIDWVENNGGWKEIQGIDSSAREATIHRLIHLGAKSYLHSQDLDMSCESNIGVGQEDIKISRGNDKTIIEVKLSSNTHCKNGYEKQLPRYAAAEHTKNTIFVLVLVDENNPVFEVTNSSKLVTIDARVQKSASKL